MKKLLIITYFFPPLNNIASGRWSEMLSVLKNEFEVFVIAPSCEGDLPVVCDDEHLVRIGSRKSAEFTSSRPSPVRTLAKRLLGRFVSRWRAIDPTTLTWYMKHRHQVMRYCEEVNPDVVLTSILPASAALFGRLIKKRRPDIKWVVDIRDAVAVYNRKRGNPIQYSVDRYIDRKVLADCDLMITVSRTLAEIFSPYYGRRVEVVYNGYGRLMAEEVGNSEREPVSNGTLTLYYAGKIYPHQEKSFFLLLNTIKDHGDLRFRLRLIGFEHKPHEFRNQIARFRNYLSGESIENVEILPPAKRALVHQEELQADILVILEDLEKDDIISKGTLTGKLFEYLRCNAPILAVCRDDSEIGEILAETGRGRVVTDRSGIESFLSELNSFAPNPKRIARYSRDAQGQNAAQLIRNLIEPSSTRRQEDLTAIA